MFRLIISAYFILLLAGCHALPNHLDNNAYSEPAWVKRYPGTGVTSSAGTHAYGRQKQMEMARLSARTEFAKQQGVTIDNVHLIEQNQDGLLYSGSQTLEKTLDNTVKATIKDEWYDAVRDVYHVWLVPVTSP